MRRPLSCSTSSPLSSFQKIPATIAVETAHAQAARQPKCSNMNAMFQIHLAATISTGGAAKCVSVPPMETLTNSNPSVP